MSSLEDRVRLLEDEREILRTLYQYGQTMDYGPEEDFLDVFLEDGSWERVRARNPEDRRHYSGRSELAELFRDPSRGRAPEVYFKHLLAGPRITIDGDAATVSSYYLRVQESAGGPYLHAFGRYRDELRRCADGRWRIARRHASTEDAIHPPAPPA